MRTTRFNMKEFGTRLRKLRQACGKTQEELCEYGGPGSPPDRSKSPLNRN